MTDPSQLSKPETDNGYGVWCYDCKEQLGGASMHEVDEQMVKHGWGMGLMASGQAYYSCPGCAPGLFNFHPLHARDIRP